MSMRTAALRPILRSKPNTLPVRHLANDAAFRPAQHIEGLRISRAASMRAAAGLTASVAAFALWASMPANNNRRAQVSSRISSQIEKTATTMEMSALGSSVDAINHSLGFVLGHMDIHTPYQHKRRSGV